jgi:glycosyltransferase involved in cell wall biosynthesis
MAPFVSCIMSTGLRRKFLPHAIRFWNHQTHQDRELIILDDDPESSEDLIPKDERIRYVRVPYMTPLAAKMNKGISMARGPYIQKMDDDDYYAPHFLETMVKSNPDYPNCGKPFISAAGCSLCLITYTGKLKFTGYEFFLGATFFFPKAIWEKIPFNEKVIPECDYRFMWDQTLAGAERISVTYDPEFFMFVRHGERHTWVEDHNVPVEQFFSYRNDHRRSLEEYLAPDQESLKFYQGLIREKSKKQETKK